MPFERTTLLNKIGNTNAVGSTTFDSNMHLNHDEIDCKHWLNPLFWQANYVVFKMKNRIINLSLLLIFISIVKINAQYRYIGKVVNVKGSCTWLIRITESDDPELLNKLVEPSGEFPIEFQRKRLKLKFGMHPLRQPVLNGCRANFVGSIIDPVQID